MQLYTEFALNCSIKLIDFEFEGMGVRGKQYMREGERERERVLSRNIGRGERRSRQRAERMTRDMRSQNNRHAMEM